ncbi:MAG: type II secretion system protein M [Gammaproteobacteria bacterium]|nr:type II secretion system protein M [Gammaproteobacteria bacterium]MDH3467366.1 type II secretion system protein M [Gammaproteobacteria bacterium]
MREFWFGLRARERLILVGGACLALAILAFVYIWQPWHRELVHLRDSLPDKRETLSWMQQQAELAKPLLAKRTGAASSSTQTIPVLTVIEQTANRVKLRTAIRRMQPGTENDVKVWLSDASFDTWVRWVEVLRQNGIEVASAVINRADNNKVSIRVVFQRA